MALLLRAEAAGRWAGGFPISNRVRVARAASRACRRLTWPPRDT
jgi:hypothetical protein